MVSANLSKAMNDGKARLIRKQYARRELLDYRSPYVDPFEYRSIETVSIVELCRLMIPFVEAEQNQDVFEGAKKKLEGLIEFADSLYQPEKWLLAFKDSNPIGYVFPQRYWDKPEEGSIFDIAILPEMQGKGYGKILHAKGLQTLAEIGVKSYVGSTDVQNLPMIAIFRANGCQLTKVHTIEFDNYGNQRIIKSE